MNTGIISVFLIFFHHFTDLSNSLFILRIITLQNLSVIIFSCQRIILLFSLRIFLFSDFYFNIIIISHKRFGIRSLSLCISILFFFLFGAVNWGYPIQNINLIEKFRLENLLFTVLCGE